jgi:hypothetical protein
MASENECSQGLRLSGYMGVIPAITHNSTEQHQPKSVTVTTTTLQDQNMHATP